MKFSEYVKRAMSFKNKELEIEEQKDCALHGLIGEAGEIVDVIKKHKFQGHKFDRNHVLEECGDVLWYSALMVDSLGLDIMEIDKMENKKTDEMLSILAINTFHVDIISALYLVSIDEKLVKSVIFIILALINYLGEDIEAVFNNNIEKLSNRYKRGFSTEASINRC